MFEFLNQLNPFRSGGQLDPQAMVSNTVQGATQAGGNFFQDLVSAPFRALSGAGQGALNGVLRFGLWGSAIALGALSFAPDMVRGLVNAVAGEGGVARLTQLYSGGLPSVLMGAAALGGGAGAALGGVTGLFSGLGGGRGASPEGPGLGTIIGGGVALAAVTAVAIGSVKLNGVELAADQGGEPRPDTTPGRLTPGRLTPGEAARAGTPRNPA